YESGRAKNGSWDRTISNESRGALRLVAKSDAVIRAAAAKRLLPLYPRWNDEQEIDEATFKRRLKLEALKLLPSGGAEVFFEDDEMFGGHAINVVLDPHGKVLDVELFG